MRLAPKLIRLLALVVWVGGLIFFAAVVAPVAFRTLPSSHEAGLVVGASLRILHWMGLSAGAAYLLASAAGPKGRRWWLGPALIVLMMVLTGASQWGILPRMERDRTAAGGDVAQAAVEDPARMDFDRMHGISERVEGGVLLIGLGVVLLFCREGDGPQTEARV